MDMALPNVSFHNNLGTISFERCLVGVSDNWQWNGSSVVHVKTIEIEGFLGRHENTFEDILTVNGESAGEPGTLTLPWTSLERVKIQSIDMPEGNWIDFQPVNAVFVDDRPAENVYTIHFFDLELHNPRVSFGVTSRKIGDYQLQMPMFYGGGIDQFDVRYGSVRTWEPHSMMDIGISGSIILDDGVLPPDLIAKMAMRLGTINMANGSQMPNYDLLPVGYPSVFPLSLAVPELDGSVDVYRCFVSGGRAVWDVEQAVIHLDINLRSQPQTL